MLVRMSADLCNVKNVKAPLLRSFPSGRRSLVMSHRRRSRAAGSPHGDAGPAPTPEKSGRIRPWAVLGSDRRVLALALAFRAVNALLVRTYFNPDEHWQCLEVAHRVAFG